MSLAKPVTFFPPKPPRAKKGKKPLVAFRPPPDLESYLEEMKDRGYGHTEVVVHLMRVGRDAEAEASVDLARMQAIASAEGLTVGRMLGRLAKAGLVAREKDGKGTKK